MLSQGDMNKITIILLLISFSVQASDLQWHAGSIVLADKTVHKGEVVVHGAFDLVLFRDASGVMVYPAHKISALYYFDVAANINRKYVSLATSVESKHFAIFEIVLYGDIKVVRKVQSQRSDTSDDRQGYNYFIHFQNELISMNDFDKTVFPLLSHDSPSLPGMVSEAKLNPSTAADVIPILKLFFQLQVSQREAESVL